MLSSSLDCFPPVALCLRFEFASRPRCRSVLRCSRRRVTLMFVRSQRSLRVPVVTVQRRLGKPPIVDPLALPSFGSCPRKQTENAHDCQILPLWKPHAAAPNLECCVHLSPPTSETPFTRTQVGWGPDFSSDSRSLWRLRGGNLYFRVAICQFMQFVSTETTKNTFTPLFRVSAKLLLILHSIIGVYAECASAVSASADIKHNLQNRLHCV